MRLVCTDPLVLLNPFVMGHDYAYELLSFMLKPEYSVRQEPFMVIVRPGIILIHTYTHTCTHAHAHTHM